jgi:outer membrane receptor for ferrienterochelin and colicin
LRPYVNLTYLPTLRNEDYSGSSKAANFAGNAGNPSNLVLDGRLPNTSKTTASYGLDFVEPNIDLTANINATYAGSKWSQDYSLVQPGDYDYSKAVWTEYTPGTIVGMSLEQGIWEFADMGKLKVRAEVNNLFDKYDEAYLTYPGPGRNYYVGLVYKY